MAKRPSEEVKSWWELGFDEGPYKFRKLNRHHHDQDQVLHDPPALQGQDPQHGGEHGHLLPYQQDAPAADEDMPDAN